MSEVIGFVLGYFMSFLLLLLSLYAFQLLSDEANERAAETHFRDIANRVAGGVLAAVEVGTQRASAMSTAATDTLRFQNSIRIPTHVRGLDYRIELTDTLVTVSADKKAIEETATLFNLQVAGCSAAEAVCDLSGTVRSNAGRILIKYEYVDGGSGCSTPINCITISEG